MNRTSMSTLIGTAVLASTATVAFAGQGNADDVTPAVGERGVVTANGGLATRGRPSTHSVKLGQYDKGDRIRINCKVRGTNVDGNRLWYLVAHHDGTEWLSARYVDNVGAAPAYCDPSHEPMRARATAPLNARQGPSTKDRKVGSYATGEDVRAVCFTLVNRHNRWIHTNSGEWVSGRFVKEPRQLEYCWNHR